MQAARDCQKSYADVRRKPLKFQVGDRVMLKVSPWKGVVRFGKRGKLNPSSVEEIHIDDKLRFVEEPVEILDREVKRLRRSRIPIIKVRWNSKRGPEFTWEREDQFRKKYPTSSQKPRLHTGEYLTHYPRKMLHLEPWDKALLTGGDCDISHFQVILRLNNSHY
ncbi:hypothetical protein Tco_1259460 [Tanacetum coccineum]